MSQIFSKNQPVLLRRRAVRLKHAIIIIEAAGFSVLERLKAMKRLRS
jgi:hypothetical protein